MKTAFLLSALLGAIANASDCGTLNSWDPTYDTVEKLQVLKGCTNHLGSIQITGTAITDLSALSSLASVGNRLLIENVGVTDLSGLKALTSVGEVLFVRTNGALKSLSGLENLVSVGTALFIDNNPELVDISALKNLKNLNEKAYYNENVDDFGLQIANNAKLSSLSGLESIANGYEIRLERLPLVTDLTGLPRATDFKLRKLKLNRMVGLTDLSTLPAYTYYDYKENPTNLKLTEFIVQNCTSLKSLQSGLVFPKNSDGKASIGNVTVEYNAKLEDVQALTLVQNWLGNVVIRGNPSLCDLKGLDTFIPAAVPGATVTSACGDATLLEGLVSADNDKSSSSSKTGINALGLIGTTILLAVQLHY